MKVILLHDVPSLGKRGQAVEVAEGYARNFLIPRGLAASATDSALRDLAHQREQARQKQDRELAQARRAGERLKGSAVRLEARVGESGKLFGSITNKDVAEAVERQLGLAIDRRRIEIEEPIRTLGRHVVTVRLHPEVTAELVVEVTPLGDFKR